MTDKYIYFSIYNPDIVSVWSLDNNTIEFVSTFNGRIDNIGSDNFILHYHNRNVYFRDKNDFNKIIFQAQNTFNLEYDIHYLNDSYLALSRRGHGGARVYNYNINDNSLRYIGALTSDEIDVFNGVIVKNAMLTNISEYYTAFNGQIMKIGEKHDYKEVQYTYFFPEKNRMVLIGRSGVWVYDFEYEEIVPEYDRVVELPSMDVRVFPNPVRDGDVSFKIQVSGIRYQVSDFEISIYNIRGQLVRKVSDFALKSGEGTFVWDRRNDRGIEIASGVYFYRVSSGGYQMTGRFLVIR